MNEQRAATTAAMQRTATAGATTRVPQGRRPKEPTTAQRTAKSLQAAGVALATPVAPAAAVLARHTTGAAVQQPQTRADSTTAAGRRAAALLRRPARQVAAASSPASLPRTAAAAAAASSATATATTTAAAAARRAVRPERRRAPGSRRSRRASSERGGVRSSGNGSQAAAPRKPLTRCYQTSQQRAASVQRRCTCGGYCCTAPYRACIEWLTRPTEQKCEHWEWGSAVY